MSNTKNTTVKTFPGDDRLTLIPDHLVKLVEGALVSSLNPKFLQPMTIRQVENALSTVVDGDSILVPVSQENKQKLLSALMVAEHDLYVTVDDDDETRDGIPLRDGVRSVLRACGYREIDKGHGYLDWIPIDIWIVAMDETKNWSYKDQPWAKYIERIEGIYVFDKNQITHLASFSGSYFLEHLEDREVLKNGVGEELGDREYEELRDRVNSWMMEGPKDDSSSYFDERNIDKFLENNEGNSGRVFHYGNPGLSWDDADGDSDEDRHRAIMEDVCDNVRANSFL